jgi:hypothetical protein
MVSLAARFPFLRNKAPAVVKAPPAPKPKKPPQLNFELVGPIVMRFKMPSDVVLGQPWRFPPECRVTTPGMFGGVVWWQGHKVMVQKQDADGNLLTKRETRPIPDSDETETVEVPDMIWGLAPLPIHRMPRLNIAASEHIAEAQAESDPHKRLEKSLSKMPMPTFTATHQYHTGDEPLLRKFVANKVTSIADIIRGALPIVIIIGEILLVYVLYTNLVDKGGG